MSQKIKTDLVVDGKVGVGTDAPVDLLNVNKENAESKIVISRGGTNLAVSTSIGKLDFYADYNGSPIPYANINAYSNALSGVRSSLDFNVKSTSGDILTGLTVYGTSSGVNVGVGTTSPSQKLHVVGDTYLNGKVGIGITPTTTWDLRIKGDYPLQLADSSSSAKFEFYANLSENRYLNGAKIVGYNQDLSIDTNSSTYDIILASSGGNVGIGTTAPNAKLQVESGTSNTNGSGIRINRTGSFYHSLEFTTNNVVDWSVGQNSNNSFEIYENGLAASTRFTIKEGGNIGIGTTTPGQKLSVVGNASFTDTVNINKGASDSIQVGSSVYLNGGSGSSYTQLQQGVGRFTIWGYNGLSWGEKMTIRHTDGYVGIGTTNPSRKLQVSGDAFVAGEFLASTNGLARLNQYDNGLNGAGEMALYTLAGTGWNTGDGLGRIRFYTVDTSGIGVRDVAKIEAISENGDGATTTTMSGALAFYTSPYNANVAERMRITSNGKVGIGTDNPFALLSLQDATNAFIRAQRSSGTNQFVDIGTNSAGQHFVYGYGDYPMLFATNASTRMIILSNGNVGIGTTSPVGKLNINTGLTGITQDIVNQASGTISFTNNSSGTAVPTISGKSSNNAGLFISSATPNVPASGIDMILDVRETDNTDFATLTSTAFRFSRAGNSLLEIKRNGNIGIGTTSPVSKLHVVGEGDTVTLQKSNNIPAIAFLGTSTNKSVIEGGDNFNFYTGGSSRVYITNGGNVGIGTTTANTLLSIDGVADNGISIQGIGTTATRAFFGLDASGDGYMSLTNGSTFAKNVQLTSDLDVNNYILGNVGIGTTSPSQKLHVVGNTIIDSGDLFIGATSGVGSGRREIVMRGGNGSVVSLGNNTNADRFQIASDSGENALLNNKANAPMIFYTNATERMRILAGGNVGIGTTSPLSKFVVSDSGTTGIEFIPQDSNSRVSILSYDRVESAYKQINFDASEYLFRTAGTERMRIASNGYVGIGTTSPTANLDVYGVRMGRGWAIANRANIRLDSANTGTPADILFGHTAGANETSWNGVYWSLSSRGLENGNRFTIWRGSGQPAPYNSEAILFSLEPSGNLGLGVTAPAQKLDVAGNILADNWISTDTTSTRSKFILWNGDGAYAIGMGSGYSYGYLGGTSTGTDYAMSFQMNNSSTRGFWWGDSTHTNAQGAMSLTTDGKLMVASLANIGYGETATTPSTTYTLDVNGTIRATNDVYAYSDARVKENVETIDNALDKVMSMRGVSYNRTDNDDKSKKVGVIAQEIQKVLPEVVSEQEDGMLSVSYGNIVGVLIEAIKEQQRQIDELKALLNGSTK